MNDALNIEEQLQHAVEDGDHQMVAALLDAHPEKLQLTGDPYDATLLHMAAQSGQLAVVDLLLQRGLDANVRESGDNTYAMHWAAAAGRADIVQRLIEAGGDVTGSGDDHELEVIGWATCWDGCNDEAHRQVVDVLLANGAQHHIFSAIAMNLAHEVRQLVARDPAALNRRMSRNENHRTPLQHAIRLRRPEMVALLLELGADPLAVDGFGMPATAYAESEGVDPEVLRRIRTLTQSELKSADRGARKARVGVIDLVAAAALKEWETAERLTKENSNLLTSAESGALHMLCKRGDLQAARWLLEHGIDPDSLWAHWDSHVTALHLAVLANHYDVARALIEYGADPSIRDSLHDSDPLGWAQFFGRAELVHLLSGK